MSKMMHDQPSAAVPASRDRRNFLIAGAGLALAATTLGRSGAVMAKPAGQDTPNAPSDAAPVRKETLTTRKLGSLEVSSMGLGCLPMVGYYGGGPRDRKAMGDRVLHWYEGNQHAPLNGVMSFFHKQTTFSYASLGPKSV